MSLRASFLAFAAFASFAFPGFAQAETNAAAVKSGRQVMNYDVYAGGFQVVSADLTVDLAKKGRYDLRLGADTHGLLAKLAPWQGVFETVGWYNEKTGVPQPEKHSSDTTFRKENEVIEFLYNKDGSFREHRIFNEEKKGAQPPLPELSDDSTDVLSATLVVMNNIARNGKCEGSDKIFDGARSYNLIYRHQGEEVMKASDLNVYAGPAVSCTVEVKPLKGRWHEKPRGWMSIQEQGRERGTMPTVWFAQLAPGEPAVPVKIRVKTQYGSLMMHLTGYKGAGKTLSLKK